MCGETRIPRDMCAGKHYTWGNTYHYDTGIDVKMRGIFTTILLYTHEEYSDTATTIRPLQVEFMFQGVVTLIALVEPSATGIKIFDR